MDDDRSSPPMSIPDHNLNTATEDEQFSFVRDLISCPSWSDADVRDLCNGELWPDIEVYLKNHEPGQLQQLLQTVETTTATATSGSGPGPSFSAKNNHGQGNKRKSVDDPLSQSQCKKQSTPVSVSSLTSILPAEEIPGPSSEILPLSNNDIDKNQTPTNGGQNSIVSICPWREVEVEVDLIPNALQKYQKELESTFPLRRIHDFHDVETINEVARIERLATHQDFVSKVIKFTGNKLRELWKQLDNGILKITQDLLRKNQDFKEKSVKCMRKMLCEEFENSVELQLSQDPNMDLNKLQEVLDAECAEVLKSSWTYWAYGVHPKHIDNLEENLREIGKTFLEKQAARLQLQLQQENSGTATGPVVKIALPQS